MTDKTNTVTISRLLLEYVLGVAENNTIYAMRMATKILPEHTEKNSAVKLFNFQLAEIAKAKEALNDQP